jgi:diguanylate cyclase (GGDEF)-like protein
MGDEFIVILPSTTADQALAVAERLRASVETASQDWLYPTSISIGIACYPRHGGTAGQLLEAAEAALKVSKQSGKNRLTVAP